MGSREIKLTKNELAEGLRSWLLNGDETLPDLDRVGALAVKGYFEIVMQGKRFSITVKDMED